MDSTQETAGQITWLHVAGQILQPDIGGHVAGSRLQLGQHRAEIGGVRLRIGVAGHGHVHAAVVAAVAMCHGANQAKAIGQAGQAWLEFTDVHSGDSGSNWPIGTPDFCRGSRLGVPAIDVAGAAVLHDEDARFFGSGFAGTEQIGQTQAEHADAADLEETAAGNAGLSLAVIHGYPPEITKAWACVERSKTPRER
jgi:hypothetical protein